MAHVHRTAPGPHHPNRTTFRAPAHPRVASREAIHLRRGPFMNGLLSQLVVYGIGIVMPNPIFAAAGSIQIVKAGVAPTAEAAYLIVFIVISLSTMLVPVALYARRPGATALRLLTWKAWLAQNSGLILTVLMI